MSSGEPRHSLRAAGLRGALLRAGGSAQAGALRREVQKGDLPSIALGHGHGRRKKFRDRIVHADLPLPDHVHQQERREHLRDRANFEDRVAVGRPFVALRETAVRDHAPPAFVDYADDECDALILRSDSFGKNASDVSRGRKARLTRRLRQRGSGDERAKHRRERQEARTGIYSSVETNMFV